VLTGVDPGFVNLAGKTAEDFDLVAGSQAIDGGTATAYTLDYLNRTVPDAGGIPDIGAFEYGSAVGAERPDVAVPEGSPGTSTPPPGAVSAEDQQKSGDDGGCGCAVADRTTPGWRWLLGLGFLGVSLVLRRRRFAGHRSVSCG
jgi:MYXO-CTERM domain-containing protein